MLKKGLSIVLMFVMLLSVFAVIPITAYAASSGTTGDCTWAINGDVLTISGNGKMGDYSVFQSERAPWYNDRDRIKQLVITDGVTTIGAGAFLSCSSLSSAIIPDSVGSIGRDAFQGCSSLTGITIPDSVPAIVHEVFAGCTGLKNVTISHSVKTIGWCAFSGCTGLTGVTIPESVTAIHIGAFSDCTGLTSVDIPKSMERISDNAFYNCANLSDVYYAGTEAEWKRITIGSNNPIKNVTIHYNCKNNELDFSRDVWKFSNFSDKECELEDVISSGNFSNPYFEKLKPVSRAVIEADMKNGAEGHCFGMAATVVLQKLGLEDLTKWPKVDSLHDVLAYGVARCRICYYHAVQDLWDFKAEMQRFQKYSVSQRLELLAQRADNVKHGGNPVLLCYQKKGWGTDDPEEIGGHAVVAYALEEGPFVSSTTDKQYDHRVLVYDCNSHKPDDVNNVIWSKDYCLLFNKGTDEWEIPAYARQGISSSGGATIDCAAVDTASFDAIDDVEQEYDLGICPTFTVNSSENIILKNKDTGEKWSIDVESGAVTGSSKLYSYRGYDDATAGGQEPRLNVVLPDSTSEYEFTTESSDASELNISVLYYDKYLSVKSGSAQGAELSSDGTISVNGNQGDFELVAANNLMKGEERYDTFTVSGKNAGDTKLSVSDAGIQIDGDHLTGLTVEASDEKDTGGRVIEEAKHIELGNEKSEYDPLFILGDVNGNKEVESVDVTICQRYLTQMGIPYTEEDMIKGDVDDNEVLELTDVTAIQYYLASMNLPYPIGERKIKSKTQTPSQPEKDTILPYITVSCAADSASLQIITMKMADNVGMKKYGVYCDPWASLSSGAAYTKYVDCDPDTDTVSFTADQPGRYYLNAIDTYDNRADEVTIDFIQYDLEPNGGIVDVDSVLVGRNAFKLPVPYRNNYQFIGWSKKKPNDYVGDIYQTSEFDPMREKLYANWMPSGKQPETAAPTVSIEDGTTLNMNDSSGIKGYYWGLNEDYRKNLFIPSNKTTVKEYKASPNRYYLTAVDIYGNVSETVYSDTDIIVVNANGGFYGRSTGIGGTMPLWRDFAAKSYHKPRDKDLTPAEPIRAGYVFVGWAEKPNALVGKKTITTNGSKTYYAVWKRDNNHPKKLHCYASGGDSWGYDWKSVGGEGIVKVNCYYSIKKKQYDFEIVGIRKGQADVTIRYKDDIWSGGFEDYDCEITLKVLVDENLNVTQE